MKLDLYLALSTELNPKCTKDLNIRAKTIKLVEGNFVENLHDIGFGSNFLYIAPKAQVTKMKDNCAA